MNNNNIPPSPNAHYHNIYGEIWDKPQLFQNERISKPISISNKLAFAIVNDKKEKISNNINLKHIFIQMSGMLGLGLLIIGLCTVISNWQVDNGSFQLSNIAIFMIFLSGFAFSSLAITLNNYYFLPDSKGNTEFDNLLSNLILYLTQSKVFYESEYKFKYQLPTHSLTALVLNKGLIVKWQLDEVESHYAKIWWGDNQKCISEHKSMFVVPAFLELLMNFMPRHKFIEFITNKNEKERGGDEIINLKNIQVFIDIGDWLKQRLDGKNVNELNWRQFNKEIFGLDVIVKRLAFLYILNQLHGFEMPKNLTLNELNELFDENEKYFFDKNTYIISPKQVMMIFNDIFKDDTFPEAFHHAYFLLEELVVMTYQYPNFNYSLSNVYNQQDLELLLAESKVVS